MKDDEYIFTFLGSHEQCDQFVAINAPSYGEARAKMFEMYGNKWGFQYSPPNARDKAGVDRFGLKQV